ncbi:gluconate 2-dehydrogenase subunit 3 family protein [Aquirufa lenticrescens]|uniref:gluconate 2-dehydrogenase subunit 3 family protein n=1 Tax=Aquirufa lenticrescens TaxID=2696560 RepID=UPI001CAA6F8E|nr:gluconate 2-dehydrogenase subunit 3 family protein [Aquirufa lenticrescens]UAJ13058.1 gluconate 2-dehydrogenase subunit 3 family protein [Aquirufa lenticrescens]
MKSISRRNWVKGMALATLGSVVFTDLKAANAPSIQWSADQDQLLQAWMGVIIPESSIPGAVSLGVPAYVKVMLRDCYEPTTATTLMKVLAALPSIEKVTESEKEQLFFQIEQGKQGSDAQKAMKTLKGLTIQGYTTTEYVMVNHFNYMMAPGFFNGCEPIKK